MKYLIFNNNFIKYFFSVFVFVVGVLFLASQPPTTVQAAPACVGHCLPTNCGSYNDCSGLAGICSGAGVHCCEGACTGGPPPPGGYCNVYDDEGRPETVANIVCSITRTVNILLILGGVIFSFVIVLGAYKYFTSMGDPKGVMGARNTLTYGVFGFLIVVGAMAIVVLIGAVLGADIGNPVEGLRTGICDLLKNTAEGGAAIVSGPCN